MKESGFTKRIDGAYHIFVPCPNLATVGQGFVKERPQVAAARTSVFLVKPPPQLSCLPNIHFVPAVNTGRKIALSWTDYIL